MQKFDYTALSPGDRKVAWRMYRVLVIVYAAALVLLGVFAVTNAKLSAPTVTAGGDVRNQVPRHVESHPLVNVRLLPNDQRP